MNRSCHTLKLSSKGQIALPKSLRDRLGLEVGAELEVSMNEEGQIILSKKVEPGFYDHFVGLLAKQSVFGSGDEAREHLRVAEAAVPFKAQPKKP